MLELFLGAETLSSTIRLSVPLILACLAGLWSERSGIVDIGLEGKMLAAAFAAAAAASYFGNPWIALVIAIGVSTAFALVHGYAAINQRGNQVVSGVAISAWQAFYLRRVLREKKLVWTHTDERPHGIHEVHVIEMDGKALAEPAQR